MISRGLVVAQTEWLTPEDAARYLSLTPKGLEDYRRPEKRSDGPPFYRVNHRIVRYRRSDLDAWMLARGERLGGEVMADAR